jgi:hypothetical protein
LHNHARGDDGRDTEFHEGTLVGGEDDSEPVEGVSAFLLGDAVERNLAANKINEERNRSPDQFVVELLLYIGLVAAKVRFGIPS